MPGQIRRVPLQDKAVFFHRVSGIRQLLEAGSRSRPTAQGFRLQGSVAASYGINPAAASNVARMTDMSRFVLACSVMI